VTFLCASVAKRARCAHRKSTARRKHLLAWPIEEKEGIYAYSNAASPSAPVNQRRHRSRRRAGQEARVAWRMGGVKAGGAQNNLIEKKKKMARK